MVEVKICGLSTIETIETAIDGGADFVGLMFYPPSPRNLTFEEAVPLADRARGRAKIVAVTVDPDDQLIDDITSKVKPDFIQCHGSETPERIDEISRRSGLPVIKAIKVRDPADLDLAASYSDVAKIVLYDAKAPEDLENPLPGGNGVQFDWTMLAGKSSRHPFMLSGGIHAENVAEAIRIADPAFIDVSSGVETSPGIKDEGLIKSFLASVNHTQSRKI